MVTQQAPVAGSLLSRSMSKTSADAADVFGFLFDDKNDADDRCLLLDGHDNDDDNLGRTAAVGRAPSGVALNRAGRVSPIIGTAAARKIYFNFLWRTEYIVDDVEEDEAPATPPPVRKQTRTFMQAKETTSKEHMVKILFDAHTPSKLHQSNYMEEMPRSFEDYSEFLAVISLLCWWAFVRNGGGRIGRWKKVDATSMLTSNPNKMKVLGALYILGGTGATQHHFGLQTNLLALVRSFIVAPLAWIVKMSSIQKEYIIMPTNDEQFEIAVVGKYQIKFQNELYRLTWFGNFFQERNRYPTSATPMVVAKDFRVV